MVVLFGLCCFVLGVLFFNGVLIVGVGMEVVLGYLNVGE